MTQNSVTDGLEPRARMDGLSVRPVRPDDDAAALAAIYAPAVRDGTATFELDPPDAAEMRRRAAEIITAYPYFVAELDGRVVGYGYANAYRTRPAYRFAVEDSIYLAPEVHGRGIGRTLLRHLIVASTKAGFRQMIAVIGDSAQHPSIRLHRTLGFQFVGTLHSVGWKHGRWLDAVLMQRALGEGDTTPTT